MQLKNYSSSQILLGAVCVWLAGYLSIQGSVPTALSPFSVPTIFLALLALGLTESMLPPSASHFLASLPLALVFLFWSFPRFRIQEALPKRSIVLFPVLAAFSLTFLFSSWPYGIKYQGFATTLIIFSLNVAVILALATLALVGRRKPRKSLNFSFHVLMFCWLAWCASPWLGEMP